MNNCPRALKGAVRDAPQILNMDSAYLSVSFHTGSSHGVAAGMAGVYQDCFNETLRL